MMEKETNQNIESLKENATSGAEETMEATEVMEPTETVDTVDTVESTETVDTVESAETSETAEAVEPTEQTELSESAEMVEPTEQTETSQPSSPSTTSSGRKKHSLSGKILIASLVVFALISLCALGYPFISHTVNNIWARGSVVEYDNTVKTMSDSEKEAIMQAARDYNSHASNAVKDMLDNEDVDTEYEDVLNVVGDGQMGTITIPCIDCNLPIYHSTKDGRKLNDGAVHLINTALPIGGEGNHCAISAHTALPGKDLFNRLDEVEVGDMFYITVLDDTRAYKVTDVNVVLPEETQLLSRVPGKDLCTLITCTPYAVNTHRLLVTGERVFESTKTLDDLIDETGADSGITIKTLIVIACAVGMLIVVIIFLMLVKPWRFIARKKLTADDTTMIETENAQGTQSSEQDISDAEKSADSNTVENADKS